MSKAHKASKRRQGHYYYKFTSKASMMKELEKTPSKYAGSFNPTNMAEAKEKFMQDGTVPTFVFKGERDKARLKLCKSPKGEIRFELFNESKFILDVVKEKYGDEAMFLDEALGPPIDYDRASKLLIRYLKRNKLVGEVPIYWAPDLNCSARMMWHGPNMRLNRPEARKYALIIKNTPDNHYMRENGIICLADHELATHYLRMVNEGMQPWFSNRHKFGLRGRKARQSNASEEGFAAVNTLLNARSKYLWGPALLYYTSCKAAEMTFIQLYEHLARYVANPEQRWKHVSRVKKCLPDPDGLGGSGKEQVYFEGAVQILRNIDDIDFNLMYAGKVCIDELSRIRRLARMDCAKLPCFLKDTNQYKRTLRHIAVLNGLASPKGKRSPLQRTTSKSLSGPCRKATYHPLMTIQDLRSQPSMQRTDSQYSSWTSSSSQLHVEEKVLPTSFSQVHVAELDGSEGSACDSQDDFEISFDDQAHVQLSGALHAKTASATGTGASTCLLNRPKSSDNRLETLEWVTAKRTHARLCCEPAGIRDAQSDIKVVNLRLSASQPEK